VKGPWSVNCGKGISVPGMKVKGKMRKGAPVKKGSTREEIEKIGGKKIKTGMGET